MSTPDPLHARILAAIEHGEQTARAVPALAAYAWGGTARAGTHWTEDAAYAINTHTTLHGPAAELRRYAAARRVLERHAPVSITYPLTLTICAGCSLPNRLGGWGAGEAFYGLVSIDYCRELPDLADSLGVQP